ncbi:MAG: shikimate kinase [Bacteroidota bacterium]
MKKHLALTGFMGSGKTTIGREMAQKSGKPFIDLDAYIEQQEGKTIVEIFENYGEQKFREIESFYLKQVLALQDDTIIALGGGTICNEENLNLVLSNAWLITIMPSVDVLVERLWNERYKRPLIKNISTKEALKIFIEQKLSERMPYYEKADWIVRF